MEYDTVGNPIFYYDQCACCQIGTGGGHQANCPCNPILFRKYESFTDYLKGEIK